MLYCLLSRFQGVLRAMELAQTAIARLPSGNPHSQWYDLGERVATSGMGGYSFPLVETSIESLIQHGESGIDLAFKEWRSRSESQGIPSQVCELEAWIAVMPIALFFHEDEAKFRQKVGKLATALQLPSTFVDRAGVLGYAIARTLHNLLDPTSLIPQTLHSLKLMETQPVLGEQLVTVQSLLERGASLEQVRRVLTRRKSADSEPLMDEAMPIALAFYCFLSTAEDFRLSMLRSLQLQSSYSPIVTAIVAGLSGAYNGQVGIPREWCMATDTKTERFAVRLYAAWSGVLDASQVTALSGLPAVVAPRKS